MVFSIEPFHLVWVSYSALHFFLVEFSFLSCFLIRKIYRIHFDFLKNSFPGMLISASASVSSADFTSLISAGLFTCQTSAAGLILRLPHCWLCFRLRVGLYIQGWWAQMKLFSPLLLYPFSPFVLSSSLLLLLYGKSGLSSICIPSAPFLAVNVAFKN